MPESFCRASTGDKPLDSRQKPRKEPRVSSEHCAVSAALRHAGMTYSDRMQIALSWNDRQQDV